MNEALDTFFSAHPDSRRIFDALLAVVDLDRAFEHGDPRPLGPAQHREDGPLDRHPAVGGRDVEVSGALLPLFLVIMGFNLAMALYRAPVVALIR